MAAEVAPALCRTCIGFKRRCGDVGDCHNRAAVVFHAGAEADRLSVTADHGCPFHSPKVIRTDAQAQRRAIEQRTEAGIRERRRRLGMART